MLGPFGDKLADTLGPIWEQRGSGAMPTHAYLHRYTRRRLAHALRSKLAPQSIQTDYGEIHLISADWIPPNTIILKSHNEDARVSGILDRGIFVARFDLES